MQHHGNVNINSSTPAAADTQDSHKTTAYQTTSILLERQWAVLCRDAVLPKDKRCKAEFIYLYRFYVFVTVWLLGNLRIVRHLDHLDGFYFLLVVVVSIKPQGTLKQKRHFQNSEDVTNYVVNLSIMWLAFNKLTQSHVSLFS